MSANGTRPASLSDCVGAEEYMERIVGIGLQLDVVLSALYLIARVFLVIRVTSSAVALRLSLPIRMA